MVKKFALLIILMIGFVSAGTQICIDFDAPEPVTNLAVNENSAGAIISWNSAIDIPDCGGIEIYEIFRNGDKIGDTTANTFNDDATLSSETTYTYTIYAIDKVGYKSSTSIDYSISSGDTDTSDTKTSTTSGSKKYSSTSSCEERWQCEDWSECINNEQMRICEDIAKCGTTDDKPSTYQECETEDPDITLIDVDKDGTGETRFSAITGAVVGAVSTPEGTAVTAFVVLALTSFLIIRIKKKKK